MRRGYVQQCSGYWGQLLHCSSYPIKNAIVQQWQRWNNEIGNVPLHNVLSLLFCLCCVMLFAFVGFVCVVELQEMGVFKIKTSHVGKRLSTTEWRWHGLYNNYNNSISSRTPFSAKLPLWRAMWNHKHGDIYNTWSQLINVHDSVHFEQERLTGEIILYGDASITF